MPEISGNKLLSTSLLSDQLKKELADSKNKNASNIVDRPESKLEVSSETDKDPNQKPQQNTPDHKNSQRQVRVSNKVKDVISIDDGDYSGPKYDYTTFRKGFAFEKAKVELSKQRQEAEIRRMMREAEAAGPNRLATKAAVTKNSKRRGHAYNDAESPAAAWQRSRENSMDDFGSPSPAISPRPSQNLRGLKLGAIEDNAGRAANLAGPKSPVLGMAPP